MRSTLVAFGWAALVFAGGASPVHASPQTACVFDTAAFRDTVDVWFSLELHRDAGDRKRREALPYAMAIARAYQQPSRISFRTWPGTYGEESESADMAKPPGGMGLDGMIRFAVDQQGTLSGEPLIFHDSPEIALALRSALASARFPSRESRGDTRIDLLVRSRREVREGTVTFTRIPLPVIRLEEEPRMLRPGPQRYPEEEKREGRAGRVLVYYVITAAGKVRPGSIYAYEATSQPFAESTEAMLLSSTFAPAKSGGCALATGVHQYINFVIR